MKTLPRTTPKELSQEFIENKQELLEAITRVLESGTYINGKEVDRFEKRFAEYVGARYCVAVGNGYDALYLACRALGIRKGDKVGIINELHVSTTNAVKACYAEAVHLTKFLLPCNYYIYVHNPNQPKMTIVGNGKKTFIEDACQTIDSPVIRTVGFSVMACWSFHPLKSLHCYGDGGAITTNSEIYADILRIQRNHGRVGDKYGWGINSRLDEIQAAVLNVYLDKRGVK